MSQDCIGTEVYHEIPWFCGKNTSNQSYKVGLSVSETQPTKTGTPKIQFIFLTEIS